MPRVLIAIGLALAAMSPAHAGTPDIRDLASSLAEEILIPRYSGLKAAFETQERAWASGCKDWAALREAYHNAADAWARAELGRMGPAVKQSRFERIAFWPDPRNATDRALRQILNPDDTVPIAAERISTASAAVQGLPALERLLFPAKSPGAVSKPKLDARQCALGQAISTNLSRMAQEIVAEWTEPESGELARIKSTELASGSDRADASRMITDFATLLQTTSDRKLVPLYGGKGKQPNLRQAEAWRSGRSDRNVDLNIETAEAVVKVLDRYAPEAVAKIAQGLATAKSTINRHDGNPPGFAGYASLKTVQYEVVAKLPGALGITIGFNSLDGD